MAANSLLERLHEVLAELKLVEADALLEAHLQRASQGDRPYADFLLDLLEAEARARQEERFRQSLKRSRLPVMKTLEQFDFAFQPSIDQSQIRELRTWSAPLDVIQQVPWSRPAKTWEGPDESGTVYRRANRQHFAGSGQG